MLAYFHLIKSLMEIPVVLNSQSSSNWTFIALNLKATLRRNSTRQYPGTGKRLSTTENDRG